MAVSSRSSTRPRGYPIAYRKPYEPQVAISKPVRIPSSNEATIFQESNTRTKTLLGRKRKIEEEDDTADVLRDIKTAKVVKAEDDEKDVKPTPLCTHIAESVH